LIQIKDRPKLLEHHRGWTRMTQPTVVIVVDDNMDILKSVARLLAGPTSK
jgi:hypothetical protein